MSLQVWIPMNNGDATQQGISNSSIVSCTATSNTSGKIGKCLSFNGTNSYILGSHNCFTNTSAAEWSYACWIKVNNSHNGCIWSCRNSTNNAGMTIFYYSGSWIFDDGNRWQFIPNTTISSGIWYHICFTRSVTTGKRCFYLNGILDSTTSTSTAPTNVCTTHFAIGNSQNSAQGLSGNPFNGYLNDVRVYDHCLSPKEVEILARGLVLHYPMTGGGRGGENIITGTSPNEVQYTYPASGSSDRFFKTSTIVPSASQYILSFWAKSTHAGDKVRAHWHGPNTTTKSETNQGETTVATDGRIDFTLSDKWEKYWCVWTQSATTTVKHFIFPRMFSQEKGQATGTGTVSVKCVKLEEGNIPTPWMPNSADTAYTFMGYNDNTEYDVSGYNYHGTKNGSMTYSSDTSRYNVSTVFNGSNAAISKSGFSIGNQWSYGMWYKSANLSSGWQSVLLLNTSGSDTDTQLGFYTNHSQNRLQSTANGAYNSQIALPHDTNWHHYFCTYDGSAMKTYLDGVLVNTTTITNALLSRSNLVIGARSANSTATSFGAYFNGKISDVRIYATVLSPTQVSELYNTSASITNNGKLLAYQFVEV